MRRSVPFLVLLVHLMILGPGCSVPPSRLANEVRGIRGKLAEMEEAVNGEHWETALTRAKEIAELGDKLSAKILLGDPLRKTVDDALAKARKVREEVRQQEAERRSSAGRRLEQMAKRALEEAAKNKKEPRAPPDGAESMTLLASVPGRAPAPAAVADDEPGDTAAAPRGAGGEVDLDRHTSIVQGDRAGDIADDEILTRRRREKKAKDLAPKKLRIDENTPPVVIGQKPVTKGKSVAAYFTVVNNTADFKYVVAVNADYIRETGAGAGFANVTFKVEGFVPKWDDILSSQGETLTGDGFPIRAMSGLQLVAVGMKPEVGTVEKVKLEVRMRNGKVHRIKGPKDPDEDKD
ncbi:MAG: hypothetical protein ACYS9X_29955 [Planctomycetota bacterium]